MNHQIGASIVDNLVKAFQGSTFILFNQCSYSVFGSKIMDHESYFIYKIRQKPNAPMIKEEDILEKCVSFIFDSQDQDHHKRRDFLTIELQKIFPDHFVNIFVFHKGSDFYIKGRVCGDCTFENYGDPVLIVLS